MGVLNLIRHVVGLLWTSDQLVAKAYTDTAQQHKNTKTNIHVPSGIRTHDASNKVANTYALKPRGHCDRLPYHHLLLIVS
jgi:hypothetical protein